MLADLSVTKTTTASYVPGQPLSYTITVHNAGPSDTTDAQVQDVVPNALASFPWTCSPDPSAFCSDTVGMGSLDTLVDIPAGKNVTFVLSGVVASSASGMRTNTATVTPGSSTTDPNPANDSSTTTTPAAPIADLSVTKSSVPNPYAPGDALTYTITVNNAGPSDVVGASVTDSITAGLTQLAWTCDTAEGSSCQTPNGTGSLSNALVNLATGGTATIALTGIVAPAQSGTISDTVTVQPPAGTTDPNTANNTATNQNPSVPEADLSITKRSSPNPYQAGQTLTYTITVSNAGPDSAPGTHVFDMVPAALAGFAWTCHTSAPSVCDTPGGTGNINPATIDLVPAARPPSSSRVRCLPARRAK